MKNDALYEIVFYLSKIVHFKWRLASNYVIVAVSCFIINNTAPLNHLPYLLLYSIL